MVSLYGVPTCKKIINTKALLEKNNIQYEFINVKKSPLSESELKNIVNILGLGNVLNSKGPTYRKLGLKDKNLSQAELFDELLKEQGMITRPLIQKNNSFHVGYDKEKILAFLKL
jgi:Spx/MgsR family transcriptional regulator